MNDSQRQEPPSDRGAAESRAGRSAGLIAALVFTWDVGKLLAGSLMRWMYASRSPASARLPEEHVSKGRGSDRNVTLERETHLVSRRRWGTLAAGCTFAASMAGGAGFVVSYWTGASNEALGGSLAVFFLGLGAVLVLWAHMLTAHKEATDPREDMAPPPPERRAAREDFLSGELEVQRRGLLKGMTAICCGMVGAMAISLFRSLGFSPDNALYTTVWKSGQRLMTSDGNPVKADSLTLGSTTVVFPENSIGSEKSQTVLIRVDQQLLRLPDDRANWAPMGNLAFSRICTHAGCSVGMYLRTAHTLMCPCHQSTFDVLRAAQPTGGPAARPLPQLPLYVDGDGFLRAGGGFSELPGPGFWGIDS